MVGSRLISYNRFKGSGRFKLAFFAGILVVALPLNAQLTLPFSGTDSTNTAFAFSVTKTGSGGAGYFYVNNASTSGQALWGETKGTGIAIYGIASKNSGTTTGVYGRSNSPTGRGVVGIGYATSGVNYGGIFESRSPNGYGLAAYNTSGTALLVSGGSIFTNTAAFNGSTPFTVSTTTKVTNLNADLLDGLDSSDFLQSIPNPLNLSGSVAASSIIKGTNASTTNSSAGITGESTAASGNTYGVVGQSSSTSGSGVLGLATSTTGVNYGVQGLSSSPDGYGVYGIATSITGNTYGGSFRSSSSSGIGVYGATLSGTGSGYGGYFETTTPSGTGVHADAPRIGLRANSSADTGITYGIYCTVDSTDGRGIYAEAVAATGTTYGGYFLSDSTSGIGIYANSAGSMGAYLRSVNATGKGAYGEADHASGVNYGVYGTTTSPNGYGVYSNGNLHIQGNLTASGSKAGFVADIVKNGGNEPLEPGDLVEIIGYDEPVLGEIPTILVRKTLQADSRAVLGPIAFAVNVIPNEEHTSLTAPAPRLPALFHILETAGAIPPGGYGEVVTLGAFKMIKVDASYGAVRPGDLLVSSPTPGYAMRSDDPRTGTVIGKALGGLDRGRGPVPVLVQSR